MTERFLHCEAAMMCICAAHSWDYLHTTSMSRSVPMITRSTSCFHEMLVNTVHAYIADDMASLDDESSDSGHTKIRSNQHSTASEL